MQPDSFPTVAAYTFHIVDDCDTRTTTVAYFDGNVWWLPGSELAYPVENFLGKRFTHVAKVPVKGHTYGPWRPESGRFR